MSADSGKPESLRRRLAQYERAIELRGLGFSVSEISRQLGVRPDMVSRWAHGQKPKRVSRYEPDLSPSADLAYVAGFYLGDGKGAGHENKVRFELADRVQLEYVSGLVAKILGRAPKPFTRDGSFYVVDYDSVVLSDFLNKSAKWLANYLKEFKRAFLQGFFDAEGYASCQINYDAKLINSIVVGAANTNLNYLYVMRNLLKSQGISGTIHRTNKKGGEMTIRGRTWIRRHDVYHFVVQKSKDVFEFYMRIGFRNGPKAEKLEDLIGLQKRSPSERYAWFMAHYRKEGHKWVKIRNEV
ncbi:MAG: hypothetical protein KGI38_04345 [Thaumarchaeota archaeon]|nr:hypothetical protein [Nitrososphaerota archaeon]